MAICECCGNKVKKLHPTSRRKRETRTDYVFFVCQECKDIDDDRDFFRKQEAKKEYQK